MFLVTAEKISEVMALNPPPRSYAELDAMVQKGLPKAALESSVARIFVNAEDRKLLMHKIAPEATYKRRDENLTVKESGQAERLARIVATSDYVWRNSEEDVRAFLTTPHLLFQGRTPLDVSMTEIGARRVEELLWRLYYGVAA